MATQTEKRINLLKQDTTNTSIDINALERLVTQDLATIDVEEKEKREPYLECAKYIHNNITENIVCRELRKEVNFAKTIDIAADILSKDETEPPIEQVEQDWIDRFREVASNTTMEEIQQLWGRILAGEIKSPGKHSLRTLEFIKNLSQKEAQQIEKLFSFVLNDEVIARSFNRSYDYGSKILNSKLSLDFFLDMQSLGLLNGAEGTFQMTYPPTFVKEINYYRLMFRKYNGQRNAYIFTHDNRNQELCMPACQLTQLGKELHNLCLVEMDRDYLNYLVAQLEEQGFKKVPQNEIK
ncbi:unnamed protein product [Commensalibacter communis]|uniref:DUF2806 domain-containing protein n=1 Tax=Commensalibacter communis TaxID=2972786 RepID=UPI0022FF6748|nr:DUF2806 domain-containing protein [Commensalibacter communis]CAI3929084.1 unnamed protein product [Commensalibacter communis]